MKGHTSKFWCIFAAVSLGFPFVYGEEPVTPFQLPPFGGVSFPFKSRVDQHAGERYSVLKISHLSVHVGDPLGVEVRLVNNTDKSDQFYNPFFDESMPYPGELVLFDYKGHFIDDLLWPNGPGRLSGYGVRLNSWLRLPPHCYVGTFIDDRKMIPVPPGDYYVQMVYYQALSFPKPMSYQGVTDFAEHFNTHENFRSNVVKITVTR